MAKSLASWFGRKLSPVDIGFIIAACVRLAVGVVSYNSAQHFRAEATQTRHTSQVLRLLANIDDGYAASRGNAEKRSGLDDKIDSLRRLTADNPSDLAGVDALRRSIADRDDPAVRAGIRRRRFAEYLRLDERSAQTEKAAVQTTRIVVTSTMVALLFMAAVLALLHKDLNKRRKAEAALQKSEAKYRLLMEQAADAILIIDSRAVCVEANARAAAIIGRPPDEVRGVPLSAFVQGDRLGSSAVLPMLRFGHVTKGEFWILRPDGSRVPVEIRATLLEDGRVQVIARDIAERKEVDRLKDEFVSLVSHELRTPLTSIRGAIGLLATGRLAQDPEKQRRMLDLAGTNTDRLIRLINDILDVERINAGGMTFERSAANARELVESSVEALRPIAERAGVILRWECDEMRIWADPDRMIQTLTNLIGNAIKFSPAGSVVEVSAQRDEPYALFAVRDHGRGIPPAQIATVFDRFQQVDASDAREKGGTGLGLTISRGIVQQHGGRIWAESGDGDGSVFQFTVPLFADDVPPPSDLPRRAVLICDDDDDLVEVLCATLAARGCSAVGAHGGGEAIARFDASPSEVVIVDLLLPDMHGRDVIRHIHSTSPQSRIIVYTAAYVDATDRDAIRAAGARIITKGKMTLDQLANEVALLVTSSEGTQPQTLV